MKKNLIVALGFALNCFGTAYNHAADMEEMSLSIGDPSVSAATGLSGIRMSISQLVDRYRGCSSSCHQEKVLQFGQKADMRLTEERQIAHLVGDGRVEPYIVQALALLPNFEPEKFIADIQDPRLAQLVRSADVVNTLFAIGNGMDRVNLPWGKHLAITVNRKAEQVNFGALVHVGTMARDEVVIQDKEHAGPWAPYQTVRLLRASGFSQGDPRAMTNGYEKMVRNALSPDRIIVELSINADKHKQLIRATFDTATGEVFERSIQEKVDYWPGGTW